MVMTLVFDTRHLGSIPSGNLPFGVTLGKDQALVINKDANKYRTANKKQKLLKPMLLS